MVQDWLKFTRKQPEFRRIQILETVEKIEKWDLKGLDIAPAV